MTTNPSKVKRLSDYRPPPYLVDNVRLDVALHPSQTCVRAELDMRPNPAASERARAVVKLDGCTLRPRHVAVDGETLTTSNIVLNATCLTIERRYDAPFTVQTEVEIDPSANSALEGLFLSRGIYCTQCEAEGFRRLTWYPDRPDVMARFETRITADPRDVPVMLSNGNLVEQRDNPDGTRTALWRDPFPKPAYLFALVAGDLGWIEDRFVTMSGREVVLRVFVEPGEEPRAHYALDALKRAMTWDEQTYGREYDLDLYMIAVVSDFNMGAMENKGLNVFNAKYVLASPETATDQDYANIEAVIAHEYFHNWTGNRITCRDWFQLCLKEGLTVFRDQQFSAAMRSAAVKRITDVRALRARQFPEDAGPLAHPVRPNTYHEINNFYTATVYEKGAEVVRMLHSILGEDGFRAGMDLYFARHDGDAATIEDFARCFVDATGRDLDGFMLWWTQAGTPTVRIEEDWDDAARRLTLRLNQRIAPTPGEAVKRAMTIPLRIGLIGPNGAELDERLVVLTEWKDEVVFDDLPARPVLSVNRGFTAPVKLDHDEPASARTLRMAFDRDPFNRWEAGQRHAMMLLTGRVRQLLDGETPPPDPAYADALRGALNDPALDPAFKALALVPPSEEAIGQAMDVICPDEIHAARDGLLTEIGTALDDVLLAAWRADPCEAPAAADPTDPGDVGGGGDRGLGHDEQGGGRFALTASTREDATARPERRGLRGFGDDVMRLLRRIPTPAAARADAGAPCGCAYSPDASAAGWRALRGAALRLLTAVGDAPAIQRAAAAAAAAGNMTDRMAALGALNAHDVPERRAALDALLEAARGDALVIDKWLTLEATAPMPGALDRVKALTAHPAYEPRNPNRIRALIGAFAHANQHCFHRRDGASYAFLADQALEIDGFNPQIAARLLQAFENWRRFDAPRRTMMREALERVAAAPKLSRDSVEIVGRMLGR